MQINNIVFEDVKPNKNKTSLMNYLKKEFEGYDVEFYEAFSGSIYISVGGLDFIRISDHHKSFQSEGYISVITKLKGRFGFVYNYNKKETYSNILNFLKSEDGKEKIEVVKMDLEY